MKKKRKRKINTSNLMIILSLIFMITISMYSILNSSLFNTNKVSIEGNKKVTKEEIKREIDIKKEKNIFMYDMKKIENVIKKNPYIKDVEVKRKFPDELQILISEKEIYGIIKDKEDYCYIDENGDYIEQIKDIENEDDNLIIEIEYIIEKDGKIQFKNEESKKRLLYLLECMRDNNIDKKIKEISYEKDDIINMYSKDNIKIVLGNDKDLDYNVSRLSSIIGELQSESKRKGTINLTYGDYAIYTPE
ncbi:MAG: FtsQ-type POTRA domain-containing protein [Romboutsia sp.]